MVSAAAGKSDSWAARPVHMVVLRCIEPALAPLLARQRRPDKDQRRPRNPGRLHLVANTGKGAADQSLVRPADAIRDDDRTVAASNGQPSAHDPRAIGKRHMDR